MGRRLDPWHWIGAALTVAWVSYCAWDLSPEAILPLFDFPPAIEDVDESTARECDRIISAPPNANTNEHTNPLIEMMDLKGRSLEPDACDKVWHKEFAATHRKLWRERWGDFLPILTSMLGFPLTAWALSITVRAAWRHRNTARAKKINMHLTMAARLARVHWWKIATAIYFFTTPFAVLYGDDHLDLEMAYPIIIGTYIFALGLRHALIWLSSIAVLGWRYVMSPPDRLKDEL